VQAWQIVLGLFFVLLPMVLMLDFWGDERVSARGVPVRREWPRSRHDELDRHAAHGEPGELGPTTQPPHPG
jgi:hypothetical protein